MTIAALCLGAALLLTAVSLGCAGAVASQHPRSWPGVVSTALMAASTLMMVVPMLLPGSSFAWGSTIAWAAIMLGAGLLALLGRARRTDSAMTAASFLVMATMWLAMSAASPAANGGASVVHLGTHLHAEGAVAPFALTLSVLSVLAAAILTTSAVRTCWRKKSEARRIRIGTLHHPAMGLSMLLMGIGMTVPALMG